MSTLLDEPQSLATTQQTTTAAQRLRTTTTAVRIRFTWLGTRKSLSADQKSQAAQTFGAEGEDISAAKKLLDTKHPAFKDVTGVRGRILSYFKGLTLPYPEPGIRLIRQNRVESFNDHMTEFQQELEEAVWRLDEHYSELKNAARDRLGDLYDASDYPDSLRGMFAVEWDFPSVEPPRYLQQLHPEVYQQECERIRRRFDDAVQLTEAAFTEELSQLVQHLTERLSGQSDGKQKVFRDSAVGNLQSFFDRFRDLNIGSNEQLDQLVDQCRDIVGGVEPQALRDDGGLRTRIAEELSAVEGVLDGLLVDRPRRNILRRPR